MPDARLRVLALQHDIAWEDKPVNHARVDRLLAAAAPRPGALVALAELFDSGFSLDVAAIADGRSEEWASAVARRHQAFLVAGHASRGPDGLGRNCATVVSPAGAALGRYEKVHPFSMGNESKAYRRGGHLLLRRIGGAQVCPLICYDLRFPELFRLAARAGAEVFVVGANWPTARQPHWRALLIARAIENQAFVIGVNRIGRDPTLSYGGGSIVVGPRGEVLAEAGADESVLAAELDLDELRTWRSQFPALADCHPELLGSIPVDGQSVDCHADAPRATTLPSR